MVERLRKRDNTPFFACPSRSCSFIHAVSSSPVPSPGTSEAPLASLHSRRDSDPPETPLPVVPPSIPWTLAVVDSWSPSPSIDLFPPVAGAGGGVVSLTPDGGVPAVSVFLAFGVVVIVDPPCASPCFGGAVIVREVPPAVVAGTSALASPGPDFVGSTFPAAGEDGSLSPSVDVIVVPSRASPCCGGAEFARVVPPAVDAGPLALTSPGPGSDLVSFSSHAERTTEGEDFLTSVEAGPLGASFVLCGHSLAFSSDSSTLPSPPERMTGGGVVSLAPVEPLVLGVVGSVPVTPPLPVTLSDPVMTNIYSDLVSGLSNAAGEDGPLSPSVVVIVVPPRASPCCGGAVFARVVPPAVNAGPLAPPINE
jgi:hypothetical protein